VNSKVRLLFDECIGHPLVTQLAGVIGIEPADIELSHVIWKGFASKIDDEWVPQIADEGWIVISGDEGKAKSRGSKLPLLCQAYGVTYVTFSRAVAHYSAFGKYRVLLHHWSEIVALKEAPRGTGYQIRANNTGHTSLVLRRESTFVEAELKRQQSLLEGLPDSTQ
jgi:hypothetical protein